MHPNPLSLPVGMTVLERGWLSANNIVFAAAPGDMEGSAVVDTGYVSHSAQTLALIDNALQGQPLARILNTHLHSDHCGGNAALQQTYPQVQTFIAPGEAEQVRNWNESALSYAPTGQECPRFAITGMLQPGSSVRLSGRDWQIHAAPGHDPHSVILFEPESRTLISADALWENGFGVVFPEIEGIAAFDEVAAKFAGVRIRAVSFLFSVIAAASVAASIKILGALVISSMVAIPVASALQFRKGIRATAVISIAVSVVSAIGGLFASYALNVAPGGATALISVFILLSVILILRIRAKITGQS